MTAEWSLLEIVFILLYYGRDYALEEIDNRRLIKLMKEYYNKEL